MAATSVTRRSQRGSFRNVGCIAFALALWCALSACESSAPTRSLRSVEPDFGYNTEETRVVISGAGFLEIPLVSLSSRQRASLRAAYIVRVGDVFETQVARASTDEIELKVPKGLKPDVYDVVVVPPAGGELRLPDAFAVRDGSDRASGLRLRLETRADGTGQRITKQTLSVGDKLELFALLRDDSNTLADGEGAIVVRFSQDPVHGALSETNASHTVLTALFPGDFTLHAESESDPALSADVLLTIDGNASEHRLSIEDAPDGQGKSLGASVSQQAGEQLTCYAVVRDRNGAFVLNVPASWKVAEPERNSSATGESLSLALEKAGVTQIEASYAGLEPALLRVRVAAGPALQLALVPDTAQRQVGDAPVYFSVHGEDAFGNSTEDVGELSFAVVDGAFGDFDASDATLTPRRVGSGHLSVRSSYGLELTSGLIEVSAGTVARLRVLPETLQLTADDPPVQFEVEGYDAFDNVTDGVGALTWSVVNGGVATLSERGELDPKTVGTGMVRVSSSLGPSATSGLIQISAGALTRLHIQPQTWNGKVGDVAQQFSVFGADADDNAVADVGGLSFRIASGAIATLDAQTGLFTPTVAGQGTIEVTSSYGPSETTQDIVVSPSGATLRVSAIRAPSFLWAGENGARVEVDVASSDPRELVISGLRLSFGDWSGDQTAFFKVVPDRGNSDHIAAGGTQTLIFYVDVDGQLSTLTSLTISATGEAFPVSTAPFVFASSVSTSSRIAFTEPTLKLTAPVAPADRTCAGGRVSFAAETSNLLGASYEWRFPGGTLAPGSSATDRTPSVDFASPGNFTYAVTATYFGYPNTLFGTPIYVGTVAAQAADSYPTGRVAFSAPSAGQAVALSSFPRSDLITLNPMLPVRQCNNAAVDVAGHSTLTLFSDRGLLDPSADVDAQTPGVQVQLTASGLFDSVPLTAPSQRVEGESTLYAEYFDASLGTVTAAGDSTFRISGDVQAPSVQWSIPGSDCSAACLASGDSLTFQFSEPMLLASLSNAIVQVFSGSTCTGIATDVTRNSAREYDPAARVMYVKPPARSGAYAVRVHLPSTVTDSATAKNQLSPLSRCVLFGALGAAATAATPQLTAAALAKFSPDGDTLQDSVTWKVSAGAATSFLRVRVTRAGQTVWARLAPVAQAGEFTFVWDGSDETGRIVRNGAYGYAIEAVNRSGVASAALRGYVEVDSAVRSISLRRPQ